MALDTPSPNTSLRASRNGDISSPLLPHDTIDAKNVSPVHDTLRPSDNFHYQQESSESPQLSPAPPYISQHAPLPEFPQYYTSTGYQPFQAMFGYNNMFHSQNLLRPSTGVAIPTTHNPVTAPKSQPIRPPLSLGASPVGHGFLYDHQPSRADTTVAGLSDEDVRALSKWFDSGVSITDLVVRTISALYSTDRIDPERVYAVLQRLAREAVILPLINAHCRVLRLGVSVL